jgi:poly-gamma-glutamate synthesis protein (capsule biosynthesis protein)
LADYGPQAMLYTLDLYDQRGWPYYGGGRNQAEALSPALLEHNGNKIAFIGCNAKGGGYATARENAPGAGKCLFDLIHPEITKLKEDGYLVITTFSHIEYYSYQVLPVYRPDFIGMIDAGATIVQGSQAHQAQNFEFYGDGFIHYGLGNLFFDQYNRIGSDGLPLDQAVIDLYTVYDGQLIGMEIVPIRFVDYARPRLMTEEEAAPFLMQLFRASGWLGGKPFPWPEE